MNFSKRKQKPINRFLGAYTRFAPSPTGSLHIGGLRTALFCKYFADSVGGEMFLRIEDTDQKRLVPTAEKEIKDALEWAGVDYTYQLKQSENYGEYRAAINRLIASSDVYACYMSGEHLSMMREGDAESPTCSYFMQVAKDYWPSNAGHFNSTHDLCNALQNGYKSGCRWFIPYGGNQNRAIRPISNTDDYVYRAHVRKRDISWYEWGVRRYVSRSLQAGGDTVLMKSDGTPTYHLASIVDDQALIDRNKKGRGEFKLIVTRGQEWMSSTPLHIWLQEKLFGKDSVRKKAFMHLPLMLSPTGGKLSKRSGLPGTFAKEYVESGFPPQVLKSWLMASLLPIDKSVIHSDRSIAKQIDINKVSKGNSVVQPCHIDRMFRLHDGSLYTCHEQVIRDRLGDDSDVPEFHIIEAAKILSQRGQPVNVGKYLDFIDEFDTDEALRLAKKTRNRKRVRHSVVSVLQAALDCGNIPQHIQDADKGNLAVLRAAITGKSVSLPCSASLGLIGDNEAKARMESIIRAAKGN